MMLWTLARFLLTNINALCIILSWTQTSRYMFVDACAVWNLSLVRRKHGYAIDVCKLIYIRLNMFDYMFTRYTTRREYCVCNPAHCRLTGLDPSMYKITRKYTSAKNTHPHLTAIKRKSNMHSCESFMQNYANFSDKDCDIRLFAIYAARHNSFYWLNA